MWTKWRPRVVIGVRYLLAAVFIMYGSIKLFGGQYYYGDWVMSKADQPNEGLVWAFYGYSPFYGRVTGLFELLPALLLLNRRTATLGALGLFAVSLNITLMDFAFHYPAVKYFSLAYTLLLVFLLWQGRDRLLAAFWHDPSTPDSRVTGRVDA
jgi:uncharacterized membrane protein YphA (DoxX/SURF4 family)